MDEHFLALLVDETVKVLGGHEYFFFVVCVLVVDGVVHGYIDAVRPILFHLVLPVDGHLVHLVLGLQVDYCLDASMLHLVDFSRLEGVRSHEDIQVAHLTAAEVLVEETVVLVYHSVNKEDFACVGELVRVRLAHLAVVFFRGKDLESPGGVSLPLGCVIVIPKRITIIDGN